MTKQSKLKRQLVPPLRVENSHERIEGHKNTLDRVWLYSRESTDQRGSVCTKSSASFSVATRSECTLLETTIVTDRSSQASLGLENLRIAYASSHQRTQI